MVYVLGLRPRPEVRCQATGSTSLPAASTTPPEKTTGFREQERLKKGGFRTSPNPTPAKTGVGVRQEFFDHNPCKTKRGNQNFFDYKTLKFQLV